MVQSELNAIPSEGAVDKEAVEVQGGVLALRISLAVVDKAHPNAVLECLDGHLCLRIAVIVPVTGGGPGGDLRTKVVVVGRLRSSHTGGGKLIGGQLEGEVGVSLAACYRYPQQGTFLVIDGVGVQGVAVPKERPGDAVSLAVGPEQIK